MQSWLLKFGALAALASTVSAANLHIETTHPPANKYKSHCTVILEEPLFGCEGSSSPFPGGCGDNSGTKQATICNGNTIEVDWETGVLKYMGGEGQNAQCTLSTTKQWGHCDTDNPNEFPESTTSAGNLVSANNAMYGLAPLVAAGMFV